MKKNLFLVAFSAFAALTFTACSSSSDDDNSGSNTNTNTAVNLSKPATADNAVEFKLNTPLPAASVTGEDQLKQLKTIDITESSQILLEIIDPSTGESKYVMESAARNGNEFRMNGTKIKGIVRIVPSGTRAGNSTKLEISITVLLEGNTFAYSTGGDGSSVDAEEVISPITPEQAMNNFARTWNIQGATLELKSTDVEAYKDIYSHNGVFFLKDVLDEAASRGVNFTVSEKEDLNKQIKSLTATKNGLFILAYVGGAEDVATWSWADSNKTSIKITMKAGSTGNKFINNDTKISLVFKNKGCDLTMKINFDDDSKKKWDASLKLVLQSNE